jgi:hypothetical protein
MPLEINGKTKSGVSTISLGRLQCVRRDSAGTQTEEIEEEEEDQKPLYNRILKEAGREEDQINSWIKSVIKEAGISWNELSFLATDRSGKNLRTTYAPNNSGLYYYYYYYYLFIQLKMDPLGLPFLWDYEVWVCRWLPTFRYTVSRLTKRKMGFPNTSMNKYQTTHNNIREDRKISTTVETPNLAWHKYLQV